MVETRPLGFQIRKADMYDLVELFNENGLKAYVQRKNVKDWQAKGWSTQKPGGEAVEAYAKKQEAAAQEKE